MTRSWLLLFPVGLVAFAAVHVFQASGARDVLSPFHPLTGTAVRFVAPGWACRLSPCSYQWTATDGHGHSAVLGAQRAIARAFYAPGPYRVRLTVTDRAGHRSSKTTTVKVSGLALSPSFVGPRYYARFSHGPAASMGYFPILTYQLNLGQWSQLPARIKAMGVSGIDDAYDQSDQNNFRIADRHGFTLNINGSIARRAHSRAVASYAMLDEPNSRGSQYAASSCSSSNDTCGQAYVNDANAYRASDPTRPVWGNFTKDVDEWSYPPSGWSAPAYAQHMRAMLGSLNVVSADYYGWTDPYEWSQGTGQGTGHYGAWVYGHTIARMNYYNPSIPAYGFVECCDSLDGNGTKKPTNEMMPGMLEAAIWNILVHGGRGYVFWTTNFWDSSRGGDPYADPYAGASYQGGWALYGEHQWDPQYNRARQVDGEVKSMARDLNSPTVAGIRAGSSTRVPVAALGKQVHGKLWLLVQADGNGTHPLSNTAPMTATITLPNSVPAGTVLDVVGEHRTVTVNSRHQFTDSFTITTETPFSGNPITYGYQHHVYAAR
ncbi:MAG TPA: PKD domain-containing protein [Solirubrobacteraceae bacterium]|jgi:hypothetical protein|nr:PKD domain-containing protein [Solirubrobacteraceae bacterium]